VADVTGLQLKVATTDRCSIKKQQSGQLMGVRIEGRVMVQRTDDAGSTAGPTSSGNDRVCRHASNGALFQNDFSRKRQATLPSPDGGSPVCSHHPFRILGLGRL
jgi:hypothetical protein